MTTFAEKLDDILTRTIYDTGAKLTEVGWERWGENLDDAKQAIIALIDSDVIGHNGLDHLCAECANLRINQRAILRGKS